MNDKYKLEVTIDQDNIPNSYTFDLADEYISLTDANSILLIKYNAKITGVKWIVQESLTNTLGGQYPIFRRNGDTYYRQFSISGLMYLDDNKPIDTTNWTCSIARDTLSTDVDEWIKGENTSSIYSSSLTEDLKLEELHNYVFQQLTNGSIKLCRSQHLGDIMVILTGVSFTPNMGAGKNVFELSATATEVCATNPTNIQKYILVSTENKSYQSARSLL